MKKKRDLNTELCQAIRAGEPDKVRQLLGEGADINAIGNTVVKATPLWLAVDSAGHEVSDNWVNFRDMLSDLAPNIPKRDYSIKRQKQFLIIEILIEAGADLEKPCHGTVPLRGAVYWQDSESIDLLLRNGANPNAENFSILSKLAKKEGRKTLLGYYDTVLHQAVLKKHLPIVEALLAAGANPMRTDHEGKTPGDIAREKERWDIVEVLEKAEAGERPISLSRRRV